MFPIAHTCLCVCVRVCLTVGGWRDVLYCTGWFEFTSAWHLKAHCRKQHDSRLNDIYCRHLYSINTWHKDVIEYWVYLMLNMGCYKVIFKWKHSLSALKLKASWCRKKKLKKRKGYREKGRVCFFSYIWRIGLTAYWTCQFTYSWLCESPSCCERSFHCEQLTTSWAVNHLNTSADSAKIYFPSWTETFQPEEGFLVLDGAQD